MMEDSKQVQEAKKHISTTATPSADGYALGRTPGQRGAEILAGLRADIMPSPVTRALSRFSGRMVAQLIGRLVTGEGSINYVRVRGAALQKLALEAVAGMESATIVEVAAGLSPRGVQVALDYPHLHIIEVDLDDVVREKEKRLQRAPGLKVPANITWRAADLGVTPLPEVLDGQPVEVVVAEGLLGYFDFDEQLMAISSFYEALKPGGVFICDAGWAEGMQQGMHQGGSHYSRQAGQFIGMFKSLDDCRALFAKAGFPTIDVTMPADAAREQGIDGPLVSFGAFVLARKPTADS